MEERNSLILWYLKPYKGRMLQEIYEKPQNIKEIANKIMVDPEYEEILDHPFTSQKLFWERESKTDYFHLLELIFYLYFVKTDEERCRILCDYRASIYENVSHVLSASIHIISRMKRTKYALHILADLCQSGGKLKMEFTQTVLVVLANYAWHVRNSTSNYWEKNIHITNLVDFGENEFEALWEDMEQSLCVNKWNEPKRLVFEKGLVVAYHWLYKKKLAIHKNEFGTRLVERLCEREENSMQMTEGDREILEKRTRFFLGQIEIIDASNTEWSDEEKKHGIMEHILYYDSDELVEYAVEKGIITGKDASECLKIANEKEYTMVIPYFVALRYQS